MEVSGGSVDYLNAFHHSTVNISGGSVADLGALYFSDVYISGGNVDYVTQTVASWMGQAVVQKSV